MTSHELMALFNKNIDRAMATTGRKTTSTLHVHQPYIELGMDKFMTKQPRPKHYLLLGRDFYEVTEVFQILSIATPWLFFHISTTALAITATTIR